VTGSLVYLTTLPFDSEWLDNLRERCPGVDVRQLVCTSAAEIDASTWAEVEVLHTGSVLPSPTDAPRLRWLQLDTSGAEHLVGTAWWNSDLDITTLGGIAPVPMAEFAVMSLLALAHHQPLLHTMRQQRHWPSNDERFATLTPLPVDGATATIVGYGRVGREIARLLRSLGMHVVGVSRQGHNVNRPVSYNTGRSGGTEHAEHRRTDELPEVLARTDYLIVVVPRTPATLGFIGAAQLAALPPGACLINVSRGGVVDEDALLKSLQSRALRYASIDVFEDEPLAPESPWWDAEHALVTPHVAGLAPRYREQVLELVSTNLARYREGRHLLNRVDRAAGY
jgi:phosphoglycerate dehydrogenase-like enzyme